MIFHPFQIYICSTQSNFFLRGISKLGVPGLIVASTVLRNIHYNFLPTSSIQYGESG